MPLVSHPIAWIRARPMVADEFLAGLVAVFGVLQHFLQTSADGEVVAGPSAMGVIACLGATLPLMSRRSNPIAVLAVVTGAQWLLEMMNAAGPGWLGVLIAAYSLGAYHSGRRRWWVAGGFIASVFVFLLGAALHGEAPWGAVASTMIVLPTAVVFGDSVRLRRKRITDLSDRAERAEHERELLARQHVQDERTRIARELHDVVAHSVSVMVIQAGAARRTLTTDPSSTTRAITALENIESAGRSAMDEMRRILGVLRDDDAGASVLAPLPSLDQLPDLVRADPSLQVELVLGDDIGGVPNGVGVHVYRLVQEALTNVRRHAGRVDHVAVRLVRRDDLLDVEITDDGRGASTLPTDAAGADLGHGIIGMRERATSVGGEFSAGPRRGGGWRVHALIPLEPSRGHAPEQPAVHVS